MADTSTAVLIDSVHVCRDVVGRLIDEGCPIAVDFEGVDLCRHGELCVVQLYARGGPVWLIDIHVLGEDAFGRGRLRELLESDAVPKVTYDCRADADALWHLHRVRISGRSLTDVQVLFVRKEMGRRSNYVLGLKKALAAYDGMPVQERRRAAVVKDQGSSLFAPDLGGTYEVWKQRPMQPLLLEYAALDVKHLIGMAESWGHHAHASEMQRIVQKRMDGARDGQRTPKGRHMAQRDFS
eukprot:TRINITY_DN3399_c0_g1_i2.p2 TRINITY_DN3399_c0_g1~~TRINITY_DN3399_c0_g1_i2.p2  ORF type:complete len:265 (+),score=70.38 TRINITY_DN3399_c0_g1_i2:81-797(+)